MIKQLLLGIESLGAIVTPTNIAPTKIEFNKINEVPKIRKKRHLYNKYIYVSDEIVPRPLEGKSKILLKENELDKNIYEFGINDSANITPNLDIQKYNSSLNWNIIKSGDKDFIIHFSNEEMGRYLFKKIVGKKKEKSENAIRRFVAMTDEQLAEYTSIKLVTTDLGLNYITEKIGTKIHVLPIYDGSLDLKYSSLFYTPRDKALYYFFNRSILNKGKYSFLEHEFLKEKVGKKFLIKKINFSPKLKIVNPGNSKIDLILSNIYLNGHKIDDSPIERNLYHLESDIGFEKNENDLRWKWNFAQSVNENLVFQKEANKIYDEKKKRQLVEIGVTFLNSRIKTIPGVVDLFGKFSATKTIIDIIYTLFKDKNDIPIDSTKEAKIKNGDFINNFSLNLTKPIAFKWGEPAELQILNVALDGFRQNADFTDSVKIQLENLVTEFEGEWVDDDYYTLKNQEFIPSKWTEENGVITKMNLLTGEKIISYRTTSISDPYYMEDIFPDLENADPQEVNSYLLMMGIEAANKMREKEEKEEKEENARKNKNNGPKVLSYYETYGVGA